ncbi:TIGR03086 family metal-binding protein [Streptomyces sp. NPDC020141]|uniref:TIGR03086 family metal-binding protein n=1 Tax=Streptomyces sp. NPDC020141 TaxID=3365065 RepID=UPI00378F916C
MNDPRPLFESAADQLARVLRTVTADRLGDPTPCTEFDVRALLVHVVGGTHDMALAAAEPGAEPADAGEPADAAGPPDLSGLVDGGEWSAAYDRARRRFTAAWAEDARLGRPSTVPWGTVPGAAAVTGFALETAAHTWDLSRALGHPLVLDQGPASAILPAARQAVPAEPRGGPVPFAAVREARPGAEAYERLAAWLGREVP